MPRVNVRLSDETHTAIKTAASRKGCDLSTEIRMVLRAHYGIGSAVESESKSESKQPAKSGGGVSVSA